MSFQATKLVWDRSNHKGGALLVGLRLAYYVNEEKGGVAWVGLARLAHDVRLSVRQVHRHIGDLVRTNEWIVVPNRGPNGTNLYKLSLAEKNVPGDTGVTPELEVVMPVTPATSSN